MKFSFEVHPDSDTQEVLVLASFINTIGTLRNARVAPSDTEGVVPVMDSAPVAPTAMPDDVTSSEKPKRTRKATVVEQAITDSQVIASIIGADVAAEDDADIATSTVTEDTAAVDTAEPATTTKNYTEPDLQKLAGLVARTKGPEIVKAKITEIGGTRIADLTQDQLNQLGAYLEGVSS
jgi:hypothetical protein